MADWSHGIFPHARRPVARSSRSAFLVRAAHAVVRQGMRRHLVTVMVPGAAGSLIADTRSGPGLEPVTPLQPDESSQGEHLPPLHT
jgi:hypothetical protein